MLNFQLPLPAELHPLVLGLTFVVGLCIGSFLNVLVFRFLADEEVTVTPSHCRHCQTRLRPQDNIPVLSFLWLRGQCHACQQPISIQYPLVELATGVLFTWTVWLFGLSLQSLFLLFLVANLIVIFMTDLREKLIFQINSLSLVPAGLLYNALNLSDAPGMTTWQLGSLSLNIPDALLSAVMAVVIAVVFFEGLILLSLIAFGTEGFGHGDTHLMMGVGAFLGWPFLLLALVLGFVVQTIPAIPILIYQWIQNRQWTSLISGAVALFAGLGPLALMNLEALSLNDRTLLSLGCMLVSVIALVVFLRHIRQAQSFTYLPLGPALVIGALVALYWGEPLLAQYSQLLTR